MGLFDILFGGMRQSGSKNAAKERLRLVLVQDKIDISPSKLEAMKLELFAVISKYVEIDKSAIDVSVEDVDGSMAIVANIPVKKQKG